MQKLISKRYWEFVYYVGDEPVKLYIGSKILEGLDIPTIKKIFGVKVIIIDEPENIYFEGEF